VTDSPSVAAGRRRVPFPVPCPCSGAPVRWPGRPALSLPVRWLRCPGRRAISDLDEGPIRDGRPDDALRPPRERAEPDRVRAVPAVLPGLCRRGRPGRDEPTPAWAGRHHVRGMPPHDALERAGAPPKGRSTGATDRPLTDSAPATRRDTHGPDGRCAAPRGRCGDLPTRLRHFSTRTGVRQSGAACTRAGVPACPFWFLARTLRYPGSAATGARRTSPPERPRGPALAPLSRSRPPRPFSWMAATVSGVAHSEEWAVRMLPRHCSERPAASAGRFTPYRSQDAGRVRCVSWRALG
jgi:hypothetical protein